MIISRSQRRHLQFKLIAHLLQAGSKSLNLLLLLLYGRLLLLKFRMRL